MSAHAAGLGCADSLEQRLPRVTARPRAEGQPVGLATVAAGDGCGSMAYERRPTRPASGPGVSYPHRGLPGSADRDGLVALVEELNTGPAVPGVLVPRPRPARAATPVPAGVGPVTPARLPSDTVTAARLPVGQIQTAAAEAAMAPPEPVHVPEEMS